MEKCIDFSLRLWYNYYRKGIEKMFERRQKAIDFHNRMFRNDSPKFLLRKEIPYSLEELRLQAYCHNKKVLEEEGMIIVCAKDYSPSQRKIKMEKKEKTWSKYGRRLDPRGAMWEEENVIYV